MARYILDANSLLRVESSHNFACPQVRDLNLLRRCGNYSQVLEAKCEVRMIDLAPVHNDSDCVPTGHGGRIHLRIPHKARPPVTVEHTSCLARVRVLVDFDQLLVL